MSTVSSHGGRTLILFTESTPSGPSLYASTGSANNQTQTPQGRTDAAKSIRSLGSISQNELPQLATYICQ